MIALRTLAPGERITEPGFYRISAEAYHADPCERPSLSNSLGQTLLGITPRHAHASHPRLGGSTEDEGSKRLDLGTIAHTLVLKQGRDIEIIDAADYRTKAAQEAREAARKAGRTPALKAQHDAALAMSNAARAQLDAIPGAEHAFLRGHAEVVMVWEDDHGILCRAMVDWLDDADLWDFKTVARPPIPTALARHCAAMGYDFQGAFYTRGFERLMPDLAGRSKFRLVAQEIDAPHLLTVAELDGAFLTIGRRKVQAAIDTWARCLRENNWPGFPAQIVRLEYPAFAERDWTEREIAEEGTDAFAGRVPYRPQIDPTVIERGFA